jgi:hypothetical protein
VILVFPPLFRAAEFPMGLRLSQVSYSRIDWNGPGRPLFFSESGVIPTVEEGVIHIPAIRRSNCSYSGARIPGYEIRRWRSASRDPGGPR